MTVLPIADHYMYDVNFIMILVAAIAQVAIGFAWYHPKVFGDVWMRLAGISPESLEAGKKKMPLMVVVAFVAALVAAYVMTFIGIAWGVFDWLGGAEMGFWLWLGFAVPVLLSSILWEGKKFTLFLINAGYSLVSLVAVGVILSLGAGF